MLLHIDIDKVLKAIDIDKGIDKVLKEVTAGYNITRSLENLSKVAPEKW